MRPKLVLFDLDGVLVDSETLSMANLIAEVAHLGLHMTPARARQRWLGTSWPDLVGAIEEDLGRPLRAGWTDQILVAERAAFRRDLQPIPRIGVLLDALESADVRRCVASSENPSGIRLKLELTDLRTRINGGLYSATMVERGKPAPDLVLHGARSEGFDPADCVVIEDAPRGVAGAVAAGMRAFGYAGDPHADRAALQAAGGVVFDDMAELPELLGL